MTPLLFVRGARVFARVVMAAGCVLMCWGLAPANAAAQTLDLTLSQSTLPFASADPDTTPLVAAPTVSVTYRVRGNGSGNWQITLVASGDLTSGSETIAVSNITWTATPAPPFQSGTMNAMVAQQLAGGSGNATPAKTAAVTFYFANSWSHNVGSYSAVFTFTLTAP